MRLIFVLSILIATQGTWAQQGEVQRLKHLIQRVELSYSFERWHEQRESLETEGYLIWKKNHLNKDFCAELGLIPTASLEYILAWDHTMRSICSEELNKRYNEFRNFQNQYNSVFMSEFELEPCNPELAKREYLGPTREALLDTTGGPRLVRGDLNRCEVALTFDDGPHPINTAALLKTLKAEKVRANFFTVGRNVDRYKAITDLTAAEGHVVGNHSYSHKNLPKLSHKDAIQEIVGGFKSLLNLWDFTTPFFRFPFGAFTNKTRSYLKSRDVAEFFWNMDTRDWAIKDRRALLKKVFEEIDREKRGILLFHDIQPQTIDVMPKILLALKHAGYTTAVFIPEDLIEDDFPN